MSKGDKFGYLMGGLFMALVFFLIAGWVLKSFDGIVSEIIGGVFMVSSIVCVWKAFRISYTGNVREDESDRII